MKFIGQSSYAPSSTFFRWNDSDSRLMRRSTDFTFTPVRERICGGGEVEDGVDAGVDEGVVDGLGGFGVDGDDADVDAGARGRSSASSSQGRTGMPLRERRPILSGSLSTRATIWKPLLVEAAVVGERHAEVAGADDEDVAGAVEAELAHEVLACSARDVVADAARAELAEAGQVFADLRGVEMEALGQLGRGDGLWPTDSRNVRQRR